MSLNSTYIFIKKSALIFCPKEGFPRIFHLSQDKHDKANISVFVYEKTEKIWISEELSTRESPPTEGKKLFP